MKTFRNLLLAIFATAASIYFVQAQTAVELSSQPVVIDPNIDVSQLSDVEVELKALETATPVAAASVASAGTFYSAQHAPGTSSEWPPLPGNLFGLSVWPVDSNTFLINDLNFNYDTLSSVTPSTKVQTRMVAMVDSGPPDFSDTNSSGTNYYLPVPMLTPVNYGTNLWIAQWTMSNNVVTGIASNTVADVEYEFLTNSNLMTTNWGHTGIFILGSETTNWTALIPVKVTSTNNLFYRLLSWQSSDNSGLPDWWELEYFGHLGVDPYGNPAGDGYNNLYKFLHGMNPNIFYPPAAPQGLAAAWNQSGNTGTVNWLPSSGAVTGYTIAKTDSNAGTVQYFSVAANVLNYLDNLSSDSPDPFNDNSYDVSYQIEANYSNGSNSVWSASVPLQSTTLSGSTIPATNGITYLAVAGVPASAVALRFEMQTNAGGYIFSLDIPVSDFTNGLYQLPSLFPYLVNGNPNTYIQSIDTNGNPSAAATVNAYGEGVYDSSGNILLGFGGELYRLGRPFYDGRVQLKQNLAFLLRAATISQPFNYYPTNLSVVPLGTVSTNYAVSSYNVIGSSGGYDPTVNGVINQDVLAPFKLNYYYRNFVYDAAALNTAGCVTNGIDFADSSIFQFILWDTPAYQFPIPPDGTTNFSALLNASQSQWLAAGSYLFAYDNQTDIGVTLSDSFEQISLASHAANLYGLPFLSVKIAQATGSVVQSVNQLSAGSSLTIAGNDTSWFIYPETSQPQFHTVEYDFWTPFDQQVAVDAFSEIWGSRADIDSSYAGSGEHYIDNILSTDDWLPGMPGFTTSQTNHLIIIPVGQELKIAAYAKLAVTNSSPVAYGYLGQYFDRAYQINTNGAVTTNAAGILSPYGDYFATQPGAAALVTMPDVDTGERGTGVVNAVSLQIDKNHDGTMDLSFNGADATSQASPMRVWVNNDYDFSSGSADPFGHDVDSQYNANYKEPNITCPRDLEDWFRLWICGVPILTNDYQATLSWANVSSGSPAINLVNAVETNGGTLYLTDTNMAFAQVADYMGDGFGQKYRTISTTNTLTLPADLFTNSENKHFLFEGASIGAGELTLTIADSYGNIVAQTGVWLDLHDIKDFYELARATNVTSSVPPSSLISQLQVIRTVSAAPDESKQVIVFVHGINNTDFDAQNTTETLFKRLYWSGYHGRVTEFRWPCGYLPFENTWYPYEYNESEFWAYKSALAFKGYLNYLKNRSDLAGYDLDILAHSQGNAVASEALSEGAPFDNYILTQGAVPAQCYDGAAPTLSSLVAADTATPTPFYASVGGYFECWTNISGNLINFFNTNDFALATGTTAGLQTNWKENQRTQKPEAFIGGPSYIYYPSNETSVAYYTFGSSYTVSDWQESRAMVARSRTAAVGAQNGLSGSIKGQVDLQMSFNFGSTRSEHSAEFTRPIQSSLGYYQAILNQIQPTP